MKEVEGLLMVDGYVPVMGVRREVGRCFCGWVVPAAEASAVLRFIVDVVVVAAEVDVEAAIVVD